MFQGHKVHIGCGPTVHPDWVNVDKSPSVWLSTKPRLTAALRAAKVLAPQQARFPPGVTYASAVKGLPLHGQSARYVYSGHMIEHLSPWQARLFAKEAFRILMPGGVIRLSTPDLNDLIEDYRNDTSPLADRFPLRGDAFCAEYNAYSDPQGSALHVFARKVLGGDAHQWLYDPESLSALLTEAGFVNVQARKFRESDMPDLAFLESRERRLFIEGTRPDRTLD